MDGRIFYVEAAVNGAIKDLEARISIQRNMIILRLQENISKSQAIVDSLTPQNDLLLCRANDEYFKAMRIEHIRSNWDNPNLTAEIQQYKQEFDIENQDQLPTKLQEFKEKYWETDRQHWLIADPIIKEKCKISAAEFDIATLGADIPNFEALTEHSKQNDDIQELGEQLQELEKMQELKRGYIAKRTSQHFSLPDRLSTLASPSSEQTSAPSLLPTQRG